MCSNYAEWPLSFSIRINDAIWWSAMRFSCTLCTYWLQLTYFGHGKHFTDGRKYMKGLLNGKITKSYDKNSLRLDFSLSIFVFVTFGGANYFFNRPYWSKLYFVSIRVFALWHSKNKNKTCRVCQISCHIFVTY